MFSGLLFCALICRFSALSSRDLLLARGNWWEGDVEQIISQIYPRMITEDQALLTALYFDGVEFDWMLVIDHLHGGFRWRFTPWLFTSSSTELSPPSA